MVTVGDIVRVFLYVFARLLGAALVLVPLYYALRWLSNRAWDGITWLTRDGLKCAAKSLHGRRASTGNDTR